MTLRISSELHRQLLTDAAASPEREICGLMIGDAEVERLIAAENVADDPKTGFEIDPVALFSAIRNERAGGERLLGYYHSHPVGPPEPSARDIAQATVDNRIWLIIGEGRVTAWMFIDANKFSGIDIIITD